MLKFHPYSILTGDTSVEFVIYCVLNHTAQIENVKSTPSPGISDYLSLNEVAPLWAEIGIDYRLPVSPLSATTL